MVYITHGGVTHKPRFSAINARLVCLLGVYTTHLNVIATPHIFLEKDTIQ
ncbi:hypothetical protein NBRC116493_02930 [Aurantivibrio infirmus]